MENTNDEIKSFLEKLRLQNSVLKKLLDIFQNAEVIDIEEEIHTDEKEDTDIVKKDKK
jgi:ATP phosphoribosyltransferase regulatory subunit HisZ